MFRKMVIVGAMLVASVASLPAQTKPAPQTPPAANPQAAAAGIDVPAIDKRIETFLRTTYAWGPAFVIKIDPPIQALDPDLLEFSVTVSMGGQSDSANVYVSKNGKYIIRGELADLTVDPLAATRAKLTVGSSPTKGPADAKVTIFEFGDLECPSCKELESVLREVLPAHPEVLLVFKHFPLVDIHPWAMTAAIASQCAYNQNPEAFWKFHDAFYDDQDSITTQNISDKIKDLATQAKLDQQKLSACQSSSEAKAEVETTMAEGRELKVDATPTMFVNGRRIVGPDRPLLEQFIQYQAQ